MSGNGLERFMCRMGRRVLLGFLIGLPVVGAAGTLYAQNFGSVIINRKKIVVQRKLPPQGQDRKSVV